MHVHSPPFMDKVPSEESKGIFFFRFFYLGHDHSRITGLQEKGEGISLTPHYHFHPLHRYLDISRVITTESSPLHIGSSWTRAGKLWFSSASRLPLSYAPLNVGILQVGIFWVRIFRGRIFQGGVFDGWEFS